MEKYVLEIYPGRKVLNMESGQMETVTNKIYINGDQKDIIETLLNIELTPELERLYVCNNVKFKMYPVINVIEGK